MHSNTWKGPDISIHVCVYRSMNMVIYVCSNMSMYICIHIYVQASNFMPPLAGPLHVPCIFLVLQKIQGLSSS